MSAYLSHGSAREAYISLNSAQTDLNFFHLERNTAFVSNNSVLRLNAQAFQPLPKGTVVIYITKGDQWNSIKVSSPLSYDIGRVGGEIDFYFHFVVNDQKELYLGQSCQRTVEWQSSRATYTCAV